MTRFTDSSYRVHQTYGALFQNRDAEDVDISGHVMTPWGRVDVASWRFTVRDTVRAYSTYRIQVGDRIYNRQETRVRSVRGLTIMASRFAKAVTNGEV